MRRGGVIAAGEGSRLRPGGWRGAKAMLPIAGKPLIAHALDRFRAGGFDRVSVIINEASADCRDWLEATDHGLTIDLVVKTTPSSFASFSILAGRLAGAPCAITTVDAILPEADFCAFVAGARARPGAVSLGVTPHVDDEKPLWAELDPADGRVLRLGADPAGHVTAGLYALPADPPPLDARPFARLREYLAWMVEQNYPVYGLVAPRVFDVDRPRDAAEAERALAEQAYAEGAS